MSVRDGLPSAARRWAARAALLGVWLSAIAPEGTAFGHDPLEATATVRITDDDVVLEVILGSRRVPSACLGMTLDACAREVYRLESSEGVLPARSAVGLSRPDGDVALTATFERPRARTVRLTARHLQRNPDEGASAIVYVHAGDKLLARGVLDAQNAAMEMALPPAPSSTASLALVCAIAALVSAGPLYRLISRAARECSRRYRRALAHRLRRRSWR